MRDFDIVLAEGDITESWDVIPTAQKFSRALDEAFYNAHDADGFPRWSDPLKFKVSAASRDYVDDDTRWGWAMDVYIVGAAGQTDIGGEFIVVAEGRTQLHLLVKNIAQVVYDNAESMMRGQTDHGTAHLRDVVGVQLKDFRLNMKGPPWSRGRKP